MSTWSLISKKGQEGIGYVEIYQATVETHKAIAVVSYLPQFTDSSKERNVNVCLMFEGQKADITKGLFYEMYNEIGDLVKDKEDEYFTKNKEKLNVIITQTLLLDKMPDFDLLTNGDFSIE